MENGEPKIRATAIFIVVILPVLPTGPKNNRNSIKLFIEHLLCARYYPHDLA